MSFLSYRIALLKLNRKRKKEASSLSKLVKEARKEGGERKAQEIWESERFDLQMIDDEIIALMSWYLERKAIKRFLPTPPYSEEGDRWERSNFTGKYHLTEKGIREVREMIRKDTKERMELCYPWIGVLFGLIGAITGLIAVIKR